MTNRDIPWYSQYLNVRIDYTIYLLYDLPTHWLNWMQVASTLPHPLRTPPTLMARSPIPFQCLGYWYGLDATIGVCDTLMLYVGLNSSVQTNDSKSSMLKDSSVSYSLKLFRCHFQGCSFFQSKAHSVEGNPLKLEDEFRHPRHTAMLAAAKASLVPSPRAELKIEAAPRDEKLPVTHRQGLA